MQARIHPVVDYRDDVYDLQYKFFAVIADSLVHDVAMVHFYLKLFPSTFLEFKHDVMKINYFIDGAALQYNQRKIFVNLCMPLEDVMLPGMSLQCFTVRLPAMVLEIQ